MNNNEIKLSKYSENQGELINNIKLNLRKAREAKNFTQAKSIEGLHIKNLNIERNTLSNWEREGGNLPSIEALVLLCNLYDVDIDYILGKQPMPSSDIKAISDLLSLSYSNVEKLCKETFLNHFIDELMNTEKFQTLVILMHQLTNLSVFHQQNYLVTCFTIEGLKKINKALDSYCKETFYFNITADEFKKHLALELSYKKSKYESFDVFINELIPDKRVLYTVDNSFDDLPDNDKLNCLFNYISKTVIDHYLKSKYLETLKSDIDRLMSTILSEFLEKEKDRFNSGSYVGYV